MIPPFPLRADIARKAFLGLVACDLALIAAHLANVAFAILKETSMIAMLDIGLDDGLAEQFNKAKWLVAALLLTLAATFSRQRILAALALGFLVAFLDDAFRLHETAGEALVVALDLKPVFLLRAQDIGELASWGALGAIVFGPLTWAFLTAPRDERPIGYHLLAVIAALAFFGIAVDMIHVALPQLFSGPAAWVTNILLGTLEDSGEMLFGSLAVAYTGAAAFGLYRRRRVV
ncbi:MAG: hypothetical protein GW886_08860 [Rhodobacterales bacterium]|nr:hypothetical protein [Rhodobacterales bacterium]NCT12951.1 hypothetical protein [Rhodobacterales bacterium]